MAKKQTFLVNVPKRLPKEVKEALATEVLEYVRARTKDGKDKNERNFPKYTKPYKNFKEKYTGDAGTVNLTLTGDMLAALDVVTVSRDKIEIGYKDTGLEGQVEGNILGTYGSDRPNKKKARDFLGISPKKLQEILKKYPVDNLDLAKERADKINALDPNAEDVADQIEAIDLELENG